MIEQSSTLSPLLALLCSNQPQTGATLAGRGTSSSSAAALIHPSLTSSLYCPASLPPSRRRGRGASLPFLAPPEGDDRPRPEQTREARATGKALLSLEPYADAGGHSGKRAMGIPI
ncbi:unnamed protein product [Triticum turgidum subsp. durum]|uniref:Uncharacterized protein n=1 Tax=Triticum turgidum subsp. durum TaxID=4567 RepID=A0A9R0ZPY5_TRITD|nr:unnamed protein product [Triticum turgidum subsp. durum]